MITISVRQTFPKFQFSFEWGRTALIVISGWIPIRELGKAQVLTFIAIFLFKLKKKKLSNTEKLCYMQLLPLYQKWHFSLG